MSLEDARRIPADLLDLARELEKQWPDQLRVLRAAGVPLNAEGDGGGDGGNDGADGKNGDGKNGSGEPETFPRDYVEKLRQEAAGYRTRAQEAEGRVKEFEEKGLSEAEKLKKKAEEAEARGETGTKKLRTANLMLALADQGLTGGRAKAAAKLLDVEYDDSDEPKDLKAAIDAAKKTYGDDVFAAGTRRTSFDGGARPGQEPKGDMDQLIRERARR